MSERRTLDEWKSILIGNTYNMLTVLDVLLINNKFQCLCKCECGNTLYVSPSRVYNSKLKSCGCLNSPENISKRHRERNLKIIEEIKDDYIGKVSGGLTVLDVKVNDSNEIVLVCKCICGNIKEINKKYFSTTKSCGCRSSVSKRINLEELKSKFVGKVINWLTIIDVVRNESSRIRFKCRCKCGAIRYYGKSKLFSNKPIISCGCYNTTEVRSTRAANYYKEHPEAKINLSQNKKQFYKDHPEAAKQIGIRNKQLYIDDTSRRERVGSWISQWFNNNPDEVKVWGEHRREYYKNHPEIGEARSKLYEKHPEILQKISESNKQYFIDHKDKVEYITNLNKEIAKEKRVNTDYTKLIEIIKSDYVSDLLAGNIKAGDIIETKCPNCGNYAPHKINDVYKLSLGDFKSNNGPPICQKCLSSNMTSKYETEISEYILSFYTGDLVKNIRTVLNRKELDLYYPEKHIAIEFNGDYWHSTEYKDKDYHINKFKECLKHDILLVSIFESNWNSFKDKVKEYLKDIFNGTNNDLSFDKDGYMNNNYPAFNCDIDLGNIISDCYSINNIAVYTCGYSKLVT